MRVHIQGEGRGGVTEALRYDLDVRRNTNDLWGEGLVSDLFRPYSSATSRTGAIDDAIGKRRDGTGRFRRLSDLHTGRCRTARGRDSSVVGSAESESAGTSARYLECGGVCESNELHGGLRFGDY
jgi:hypothetical protein